MKQLMISSMFGLTMLCSCLYYASVTNKEKLVDEIVNDKTNKENLNMTFVETLTIDYRGSTLYK